ncbi:MAG TPA: hypothetical protein VKM55_26575 [Candidatus Lokiarchaeia archaeon]|nr:hypothetical protein [Candidatus Lokiarchaeia archaeon]
MVNDENIVKKWTPSKITLYFSLSIVAIIAIWSMISEARWMLFESGVGTLASYDSWMLIGVIVTIGFMIFSFFTLGQVASNLTKECDLPGKTVHMQEGQIILWWAIIIGMVLGMGFWDIVTEINLAVQYGLLNIWNMMVTVFDFGFWQLNLPVWGLVIIGIIKMGLVIILYVLATKNIRRGTVCDLAELKKDAILS